MCFRDLGERLRQFVGEEFPHGPISKANEGKLTKDFDSFNRIVNNEYRDRFPRKYPGTTVLGLNLEEYQNSAIFRTQEDDKISMSSRLSSSCS